MAVAGVGSSIRGAPADAGRRVVTLAAAFVVSVAAGGCGDGPGATGGDHRPELVVFAAASLTEALEECAPRFDGAEVRLSLAGSDALAAQIRQGVAPDVYAAADADLPRALHREGLIGAPVRFATNSLVVAVPRDSEIASVDDLARPGVRVALGSPTVPVGAYARAAIARLPATEAEAILANVRSEEPDVNGVVGKLTLGAVDAGLVYASDVRAGGGDLRAIGLPPALRPDVAYAAAVAAESDRPVLARRFLDGLVAGRCARSLRKSGFGSAPR